MNQTRSALWYKNFYFICERQHICLLDRYIRMRFFEFAIITQPSQFLYHRVVMNFRLYSYKQPVEF